ncbi:MAG: hypothetical protein AAF721_21095 [Myxococcota bacterium]
MSQIARTLGWAVVGLGCAIACGPAPAFPVFGYEQDDVNCTDFIDNDGDGLIDCDDPDCISMSTHCGEVIPEFDQNIPENTLELCRDFVDNDLNGQFDCGDPKCRDIPETCCILENTNEACSNGFDDDQNGFIDCEDFGCDAFFVEVCGDEFCGDEFDNDSDGKVDCDDEDCAFEPDCGFVAVEETTLELCSDGFDNNGDGFTDCGDFDCSMSMDQTILDFCASIPTEESLEACTNGEDDNNNGFVDCDDNACTGSSDFQVRELCEATLEACRDGEDNDEDGFPDCSDFSCNPARDPTDPQELDRLDPDQRELALFCFEQGENTFKKCSNGLDDDGNGFTDCEDFSCSSTDDLVTLAACQESVPDPVDPAVLPEDRRTADDKCSDGEDNDGDGFVDCDDWDCSYNPAVTICGARICG